MSTTTQETSWTNVLHNEMLCLVAHSCLTLCDPMDYTVHEILQPRILEWVAVPFSKRSYQPRGRTQVSGIAGGFFTSWGTREAEEYLVAQQVKSLPAMQEIWVGKIPWRRERLPTPVFWPGEFHGLYSPWGCKEFDDWATFTLLKL